MSEWTIYALIAATFTGLLVWAVAAVLLGAALSRGAIHLVRHVIGGGAALEALAPLDSCVWMACHSLKCGHLQTRHDVTESGRLVCRGCGHAASQT